jgi:hypothetical protein
MTIPCKPQFLDDRRHFHNLVTSKLRKRSNMSQNLNVALERIVLINYNEQFKKIYRVHY